MKVPDWFGAPVMFKVLVVDVHVPLTPVGNPFTITLVAPTVVYWIGVIALLIQTVWEMVVAVEVNAILALGYTVIVPVVDEVIQPPNVVIV